MTYKGAAPSADECDLLCDNHIELHQLLYGATLFILRNWSLGVYPPYDDDDDRYSDGRLVVSPIPLPTEMTPNDSIPATAYCGGVGEEIPTGHDVYIWRPGDDHAPLADRDTALTTEVDYSTVWKANSDLRAFGFVEWLRNDAGRIIKRARPSGRLQPVSRLTPAGLAEYDRFADPTADCDDVQTNPDRQE
jgi:hypothetical protein